MTDRIPHPSHVTVGPAPFFTTGLHSIEDERRLGAPLAFVQTNPWPRIISDQDLRRQREAFAAPLEREQCEYFMQTIMQTSERRPCADPGFHTGIRFLDGIR